MTTENVAENTEQIKNDAPENKQPEYSDIELQAMDQGWRPKEEYKGDPSKWVNAEIFVARAPLFEHMDVQKREIRDLKKALKEVAGMQVQARQEAFDAAYRQLKEAKKEALKEGDADKVVDIDERIDLIKTEQRKVTQRAQEITQAESQELHPEFAAWVSRNAWYKDDLAMQAYADARGRQLNAQGKSPTQVLKEIEELVREEFPNRFKNQNRERPGAVERSTAKASSGNESSSIQLTDMEKQIMKTIVATGVMTEKQYIEELKKTRE